MGGVEGPAPDPAQARDLGEFIDALGHLRLWAGGPSYRALAKAVGPTLRPPQVLAHSTISDLFQRRRRRLDLDLVTATVRALGLAEPVVAQWRAACVRVQAEGHSGGPSGVLRQLPADLSTFTGRSRELQALFAAVEERPHGVRTIVISAIEGMAGVGKTQLAVHAAHELVRSGSYRDAQLYVNLHGFDPDRPPSEPAAVLELFLRQLEVPGEQIPDGLDARAAMFRDRLSDKSALVILDNAADEAQVKPLLPAGPDSLVLITSRRSLIGLDGAVFHRLDVFSADEGLTLLARIAGAERVDAEPKAARRLIEICGYLPLAIALAAARLRARPAWSVEQLVSRLQDGGLDALAVGYRGVRPIFDLSYQAIDPELRHPFGLLGLLFKGTINVSAAVAAVDLDLAATRVLLERLADEHLLQNLGPDQYTMHDLIRAYAAEQGDRDVPEEQRTAARARYTAWYIRSARAALAVAAPHSPLHYADEDAISPVAYPVEFPDSAAALAWLTAERANLVASALLAETAGLDAEVVTLANFLSDHLLDQRHADDAVALEQARIRVARRTGDERTEAIAQTCIARAYMDTGRFVESREAAHRAADHGRRSGFLRMQASATEAIALTYLLSGDYPPAVPWMSEAVELRRQDTYVWGLAATLNNLGELQCRLGNLDESTAAHEEAIAIARDGDMRLGAALLTASFGDSLLTLGAPGRAVELLSAAADTLADMGDRQNEAQVVQKLAAAHEGLGDLEQAEKCRAHAERLLPATRSA